MERNVEDYGHSILGWYGQPCHAKKLTDHTTKNENANIIEYIWHIMLTDVRTQMEREERLKRRREQYCAEET